MVCFIDELEEELRGTLYVIAYAGHASNRDFIRERQGVFRRKYGGRVGEDILDLNVTFPEAAYAMFMHLLDDEPSDENVRDECVELLEEFLDGELL